MIYLNNAATTVTKPEIYYSADNASEEQTKSKIADFFGCKNDEKVILTESGSQAISAAIKSLVAPGEHIISTDMEYGIVLDTLAEMEERGCSITYIPLNAYAAVRYDMIENAVNEKTTAIVCCHGSNVTGNIIDLEKIGAIARRHKLRLIVDGCQTAGAIDIDLNSLSVDAFCFTGHKKLMGPHGTGGLCLRKELSLSDEAKNLIAVPSEEKLGKLCASLDFIKEKGIYGVSIFPHRLAKRFFEAVKSMKAVTVYGDFGTNLRIPTVSISVDGFSAEDVKLFMRKRGITVKSGDFNAPRLLKSLGKEQEGLVRFSFGYFNTRQEVNEAIWALMELLGLDDLYLLS